MKYYYTYKGDRGTRYFSSFDEVAEWIKRNCQDFPGKLNDYKVFVEGEIPLQFIINIEKKDGR